MATIDTETGSTELALAYQPQGVEQIPDSTILTRLNYYDGKFLRADDLRLEQDYLRRIAELGARAGGSGLVYGFDITQGSGDQLTIGGGLAFDAAGRVLYLPAPFPVSLQDLIDKTRNASSAPQAATAGSSTFEICLPEKPGTTPPAPSGAEFYLISIAHAENACGEEEVFGRLCDDGCATSTDRAYLLEGVVVRAVPFLPRTPFVQAAGLTEAHIRSQLVSAYFADERNAVPCQISKAGLLSGIWCHGAAAPSGWEVPIAVVGRLSSSTFVDEWVVRRERMETPPRRYWQGRMCMRPWDVFLAQVLQFQCQLPSVLSGRGGDATSVDPCRAHVDVIREVSSYVTDLARVVARPAASEHPVVGGAQPAPAGGPPPAAMLIGAAAQPGGQPAPAPRSMRMAEPAALQIDRLALLQRRLSDVLAKAALPSQRILLDGGLVELPPAGYLPVTPGTTPPVDEQVRRLMGPGVDLRFCVATADYIPRAFESAQHMDRISLVAGLEDPAKKPKVDVLVPNGAMGGTKTTPAAGWDTTVKLAPAVLGALFGMRNVVEAAVIAPRETALHGAGRSATPGLEEGIAGAKPGTAFAGYASVTCDKNPLALDKGETFALHVECGVFEDVFFPFGGQSIIAQGTFTVDRSGKSGGAAFARGTLASTAESPADLSATEVAVSLAPGAGGTSYELAFGLPSGTEIKPTLLKATLVATADVFTPGRPIRVLAEDALAKLAANVEPPGPVEAVRKKLFDPAADTVATSGGITATLDWVLFHRRREQDCGGPQAPPAPVKMQSYRAFHAHIETTQQDVAVMVERITGAIGQDSPLLTRLFREVGLVEFQDGTASLVTDPQEVSASWRAVVPSPGPYIVLGATASEQGAGSDTLLQGRLRAFQEVVQFSSMPQNEQVVVHHPMLKSLPAGPDGQLLFVTATEVAPATTDYTVYGVADSPLNRKLAGQLASQRSLERFLAGANPKPVDLGTASFTKDTAHIADSSLQTLTAAGLPRYIYRSLAISKESDNTQTMDDQRKALIAAVDGSDLSGATTPFMATGNWKPKTDHVAILLVGLG